MHESSAAPCSPRVAASAAFLCFAPVLVSFAVAPGARWPEYPGLAFHLAVFALVPSLRAPEWARMAGYGWLFLDVTTGVMALNHVPHAVADPVRLGAHIFAGIWIVTASRAASLPVKLVGVPAGALLFAYSFVSPFLPPTVLAPASILMMVWFALIAWQNGSQRRA
ncbi:hypothetical protein [Sorangium sp. So ce388]|uniref:hypothetical protein n=1 Tax=Sorangium sp. So ce388 TaxID=3133309 RepID=UPI003F5C98B7